jgi:hypothetical protein
MNDIVPCPSCGTRVIAMGDNRCPACGKAIAGVQAIAPGDLGTQPAPAMPVVERSTQADLQANPYAAPGPERRKPGFLRAIRLAVAVECLALILFLGFALMWTPHEARVFIEFACNSWGLTFARILHVLGWPLLAIYVIGIGLRLNLHARRPAPWIAWSTWGVAAAMLTVSLIGAALYRDEYRDMARRLHQDPEQALIDQGHKPIGYLPW